MKKILLFALVLSSFALKAQTAEEIVESYTKYMGGLDAFHKVNTAKMTGTVSTQGVDLPLTMQLINGKAVRTDVEYNGQMITSAYKDGKGWKINPLQGIETATDVDGAELQELKLQANLSSALMEYKSLGNTIELQGQETVEGVKCWKIKMTAKADSRVTTFYISADNYSMVKTVSSREIMGQTMDVETLFSDAKDFSGIKFYMTRTQSVQGQVFQTITLSNVELNVTIDEKIFSK